MWRCKGGHVTRKELNIYFTVSILSMFLIGIGVGPYLMSLLKLKKIGIDLIFLAGIIAGGVVVAIYGEKFKELKKSLK